MFDESSRDNLQDVSLSVEASDYWGHIYDDLDVLEAEAKDNSINFGPTYTGVTSKGLNVRVLTLNGDKNDTKKRYWFIALSDSGALLGHRSMELESSQEEGGSKLTAVGGIAIRYKDMGVASIIEMANLDTMQKLANGLGPNGEITWTGYNENRDVLKRRIEYSKFTEPSQDPEIAKKLAEQERWQSLYGNGGRIGATKPPVSLPETGVVFEKKFLFKNSTETLNPGSEIKLTRNEGVLLDDPSNYSAISINSSNMSAVNSKRVDDLNSILGQMKQICKEGEKSEKGKML